MNKVTLNQETMEIRIEDETSIQYIPYNQYFARKFVVNHLHWNGRYKDILHYDQRWQAYLMCDGFGKLTLEQAREMEFDWSHVRDSSHSTFKKVANWIMEQKWFVKSVDEQIQSYFNDCERAGIEINEELLLSLAS